MIFIIFQFFHIYRKFHVFFIFHIFQLLANSISSRDALCYMTGGQAVRRASQRALRQALQRASRQALQQALRQALRRVSHAARRASGARRQGSIEPDNRTPRFHDSGIVAWHQ